MYRTGLVVGAWCVFPTRRLVAIPVAIVMVYVMSVVLMQRRQVPVRQELRSVQGLLSGD